MNVDLAAQHALDRFAEQGIAGLDDVDRTLASVWQFAAGVGNGGFAGYFSSHRGDLAAEAPGALRRIGARALAAIADEANAVFGPAGPPLDRTARREQVHAFGEDTRRRLAELDRQYFECEEDVDELLEKYVAAHRRE